MAGSPVRRGPACSSRQLTRVAGHPRESPTQLLGGELLLTGVRDIAESLTPPLTGHFALNKLLAMQERPEKVDPEAGGGHNHNR